MREQKEKAIAIFCSDIHLCLTPPVYRSKEPDWFAAMQRPLDELKDIQQRNGNCPIFCAGDIFDRWNSPPELINWAMRHLPFMYAIPGQHDLPDHDISQIQRSAYQTLMSAEVIAHDFNNLPGCLMVTGFSYGSNITPSLIKKDDHYFRIAIIHQYNWIPGCSYFEVRGKEIPGLVTNNRHEFKGYDIVVSGDNHIPFIAKKGNTTFVNCGAMMQRKSDDGFAPSVWLLWKSGVITRHMLDTSQDVCLETVDEQSIETNRLAGLSEMMQELEHLGKSSLDFAEALKHFLDKGKYNNHIKAILDRAMTK